MAKNEIKHLGKITAIVDGVASVEFISLSACASCHARGACSVSDQKMKTVNVPIPDGGDFSVGESVNIVLRASLGIKAVILGYVIPLIILMVLLLSLQTLFSNELYLGLVGLGAVAVYYVILFLFKGRLDKEYAFVIEKI